MAAGTCRHCGHPPVAFDAPICPTCAGVKPNPSQRTRRANTGFIVAGILGFLVGAAVLATIGAIKIDVHAVVLVVWGCIGGFVLGGIGGIIGGLIGHFADSSSKS
jgi:hypothetical protein